MKKTITTLVAVLGFTVCFSQIIITSANMPKAGTSTRIRELDSVAAERLSVGTAGANMTWNFASLATVPTVYQTNYGTPRGAIFNRTFPTATLVSWAVGTTDSSYWRLSTNAFEQIGTSDSTGAFPYSNSLVAFRFPFTYNTVFRDTARIDFENPLTGATDTITLFITTTGDAYGNITTGLGTFPALRLRREITSNIEILTGVPIAFKQTDHEWYTAAHPVSVFTHSRQIFDLSIFGGGVDTAYSANTLIQTRVSTEERVQSDIKVAAYPNPAVQYVNVDFELPESQNVAIMVMNSMGVPVRIERMKGVQGKQTFGLDTRDLASGNYSLHIFSEKARLGTQKIVVMH